MPPPWACIGAYGHVHSTSDDGSTAARGEGSSLQRSGTYLAVLTVLSGHDSAAHAQFVVTVEEPSH